MPIQIRVYLSTWERRLYVEGDPSSAYIWNPIMDEFDNLPVAPPGTPRADRPRVNYDYPDALPNGSPGGPTLIATLSAPNIPTAIASLPGVYMLPPHVLNQTVNSISDEEKSAVIAELATYGVPYEVIQGANMVSDIVDRITNHIKVHGNDTAQRYAGREHQFG